jgi:hypothetical protein
VSAFTTLIAVRELLWVGSQPSSCVPDPSGDKGGGQQGKEGQGKEAKVVRGIIGMLARVSERGMRRV